MRGDGMGWMRSARHIGSDGRCLVDDGDEHGVKRAGERENVQQILAACMHRNDQRRNHVTIPTFLSIAWWPVPFYEAARSLVKEWNSKLTTSSLARHLILSALPPVITSSRYFPFPLKYPPAQTSTQNKHPNIQTIPHATHLSGRRCSLCNREMIPCPLSCMIRFDLGISSHYSCN